MYCKDGHESTRQREGGANNKLDRAGIGRGEGGVEKVLAKGPVFNHQTANINK